jgi:hypothetical protein
MLTVNNLMVPCQQARNAVCAPFAGIHGGTLYDLSYDIGGQSLLACGIE